MLNVCVYGVCVLLVCMCLQTSLAGVPSIAGDADETCTAIVGADSQGFGTLAGSNDRERLRGWWGSRREGDSRRIQTKKKANKKAKASSNRGCRI